MAITCEVNTEVGCVLAHICTSLASIFPYSVGTVLGIFTLWFSDMSIT